MSLAKLTTDPEVEHESSGLKREGIVDSVAFVKPFADFPEYAAAGVPTPARRGVPVADRQFKANGIANLNYWGYLEASRRSLANDVAFIRRHPDRYLHQVANAWADYLASPSSYSRLGDHSANWNHIRALDRVWRTVAYGELPTSSVESTENTANIGIVTSAELLVMLLGALAAISGRPRVLADLVRRPSVVFGLSTCLGFALVANATEVGENMRFRYETEPLQMILVVALVVGAVARIRSERVSSTLPMEASGLRSSTLETSGPRGRR